MRYIFILLISTLTLFAKEQTIILGAGCFWGVEKFYENLSGVKSATSGYAGGEYDKPTYHVVLSHRLNSKVKNHAEVVKVVYDDSKISTTKILKEFWQLHNPTQNNKQGNDIGNNYRSVILYTDNRQKELAYSTKKVYQKLLKNAGYGEIKTQIEPLKKFYKAEEYHQDYLKKHPRGYCPNHATGVKFNSYSKTYIEPLGSKEIIVIDADNCPFCKKYKDDVIDSYRGTIPLRVAKESELKDFNINSKIVGTPTTIFIDNGSEVASIRGYIDIKTFYKRVGEFKLGTKSKAFKIAFNQDTESRFCKKYKIFQNVTNGVFIDKVSGEPLFDTKDRFNSKSGWLSFYKAIDGAVEFKEDNSYGMHRVEVIAKKSGIHLGHVFNRADGKKRFCINANILEFKPINR